MILTLNAGSSSIKYSLFDKEKKVLVGEIEKVKDYKKALNKIYKKLKKCKIKKIAHRVVHGKDNSKTKLLTSKFIQRLKKYNELAPLHNPIEIKVIEESIKLFPKAKHFAVFDTAFHTTMPKIAKLYGLPLRYYKKGIKRYGFHGTSHKYISQIVKKPKVISCHLGNGCSITAIKNGKSIDTSMGFTPLEGLLMGTRSGDIDPSIISYLMSKEKKTIKEIEHILNYQSGLLGISEESNDVRDLLKSKKGSSKLALELFTYRITKYIGSYISILNGVDVIVFTAGIGEKAYSLREKILNNFKFLGLKLDKTKNKNNKKIITKPNSKIKVMVIPTYEEKIMAREVTNL
jgi:acetate kinase